MLVSPVRTIMRVHLEWRQTMLLEFKTDNYKNFADGFAFSMEPNMMQKDLPYSIQTECVGNKKYRALSSAVIYGPNAAGKSNIINAMDTFCQIVRRGNIRNGSAFSQANYAGGLLELIPNRFIEEAKPVAFGIKFLADGILFEYAFEANIGEFMDRAYPRQVLSEELSLNGIPVFVRNGLSCFPGELEKIPDDIWPASVDERRTKMEIARQTLQPTELFLMNGFRIVASPEIVARICEWLDTQLIVVCGSQNMQYVPENPKKNAFSTDPSLTNMLRDIGSTADVAGYLSGEQDTPVIMVGLKKDGQVQYLLPAEMYESYGTTRFLNVFPGIVNALNAGATLVMDEFDASLHPAIAKGIISAFHNDEINVNHAQLIVNTHNVAYLTPDMYRRDEVHLVEPLVGGQSSDHYTLADFKTSGENGVRMGEAYMRNYLKGAYGAYPDTDVGDLLEQLMSQGIQPMPHVNFLS